MADEIASATAESGLIFSPRGFPGGGQSRTEVSPGVLLTPKSQLRGRDLLPYEHAIEAGAQMLHVGNTLVPTLDKDALASLSPYVMRQLIRDILDFEGVVVAGPMDAPAVSRLQDSSTAAVLALQAGADMLYWNTAGSKVIRAIGTIAVACQSPFRRLGGPRNRFPCSRVCAARSSPRINAVPHSAFARRAFLR